MNKTSWPFYNTKHRFFLVARPLMGRWVWGLASKKNNLFLKKALVVGATKKTHFFAASLSTTRKTKYIFRLSKIQIIRPLSRNHSVQFQHKLILASRYIAYFLSIFGDNKMIIFKSIFLIFVLPFPLLFFSRSMRLRPWSRSLSPPPPCTWKR